jgi:membrane protein
MSKRFKELVLIFKTAAKDWWQDKAPRLGAALAYYALFSMAPLLILATAIAGLAFGQEAVEGELVDQLSGLLGKEGGVAVQTMIANARKPSTNILATIVGMVILFVGASGVFGQLQDALNTIWEVKPKPGRGIIGALKARFTSFAMVLVIGFLLLISLVVSTALTALGKWLGADDVWFWQILNQVVSLAVITGLFAMIFKVLPDAQVEWRDVWFGAVITSLLFVIGKFLISFYLGHSSVASVHGAAASVVVLLVWLYYSAQILLFGAEITQAHACLRLGCKPAPRRDAVAVTEGQRAQEGMTPRKPVLRPEPAGG